MSSSIIFRMARPETDAEALLTIYAPFVEQGPVTFEEVVPSVAEFRQRMEKTLQQYVWLVAESEGKVLGYAYASPYRERAAYRWCAECSIYLAPEARGQGLGKGLYRELIALTRMQGYVHLYGIISLPNAASVRLHERVGFKQVAVFPAIGYKQGAWHDVAWYENRLNPARSEVAPAEVVPARDLGGLPRFARLVEGYVWSGERG